MIAKTLSFLFIVAVAAAAAPKVPHPGDYVEPEWPLAGVDPNSLECDPRGEEHLLLPHFTHCNKFYMCVHGREVERSCAPGNLVFDFMRQVCNWAWAVDCQLRHPKYEGSGEEEFGSLGEELELGQIDTLMGDESNAVQPVAALTAHKFNGILNCQNANDAARQLAYKGDCQRYWRCDGGVPQSFYCSDGLYFNDAKMQCDHEANVRCPVQQEEELDGEFIVYK